MRKRPVLLKRRERQMKAQISTLGKHIATITKRHDSRHTVDVEALVKDVRAYLDKIREPFAYFFKVFALNANAGDAQAWKAQSQRMARAIAASDRRGLVAQRVQVMAQERADYILSSLPDALALRVHQAQLGVTVAMQNGSPEGVTVARDALSDVLSAPVPEWRQDLIARTEANAISFYADKARAEDIGVKSFIWRTMEDGAVRDEHAELDGETFTYAEGAPGGIFPGTEPNCRCYAEPVI